MMGGRNQITVEVTEEMIEEARRHQVSGEDLLTLAWTIAVKKVYPNAYDIFYNSDRMGFTLPGDEVA